MEKRIVTKQTGRTVWDFIAQEPNWTHVAGKVGLIVAILIAFVVVLVVGAGFGLRAIGFSLASVDLGDKIRVVFNQQLNQRFAHAYIKTINLKSPAGDNIKEVLQDERGNYKVIFKKPFPNNTYAAVANSTRGFVHITENKPESVTLVAYDVIDNKLSKTTTDFELTLVVYWPYTIEGK